jgi:hypothetical protein
MALPKARWQHFTLTLDHAAVVDATLTTKIFKAPRRMKILRVDYINPTGLVAHNDNFFVITVQNGATVLATRSTDANGGGSTIAADTFVDVQLIDEPQLAEGDILSVKFTDAGTQTLPAGRIVLHCRYN